MTGRFKQTLRRFIETDAQHESGGLITQTAALGTDAVASCSDRQCVDVAGEVRSLRVDTRGGSPVLEVEVYDGTATMTAVFLGRRSVAGLDAGRAVRLRGRLSCVNGVSVIYNPAYELLAGTSSEK